MTQSLLSSAFAVSALTTAWQEIYTRGTEDGEVSEALRRFADDATERLAMLAEELAAGSFTPHLMTEVVIREPDGDRRVLHIPSVRDRVVERALLGVLTPYVDPWLGPNSYAYRPGLGSVDAVQALARLRDEGRRWVLRSDVDNCFPSIPVDRALRMLGAIVPDLEAVEFVTSLLRRRISSRKGVTQSIGLPQGAPLSPLLANLVLTQLDEALARAGFELVRYSDDFAVVAETERDAWEAAKVAGDALGALGMSCGADKTEVMSFDAGFCFLGEDFGPRYPPVVTDHRVQRPDRRVLYVALQGSRIRTAAGRLLVESGDDQVVIDVPTGHVGRVVCFGSIGVSAGVRAWSLSNEVDVVFVSRRGSYLGQQLAAGSPVRIHRLQAQLAAASDPGKMLRFGRAVVEAKVSKQVIVLRRAGRRAEADLIADAVGQMRAAMSHLPDCTSAPEVMGIEGAAARAYFGALGAVLPEGMTFTLRSRQPPQDVANAALSYGYAVLLSECVTALVAAGLEPSIGLLHAPEQGRPSLALDLMEEFRPFVVDQVVTAAIRRRELRPEHGRRDQARSGVLLTKAGRECLLEGYERRMLQYARGSLPDFAGTTRRHLYRQAQRLAAFIMNPEADWTGLSWR